jgi:hypothetical protein
MITCPYCGSCFDNKTYQTRHVPCPEPHGDINPELHAALNSDPPIRAQMANDRRKTPRYFYVRPLLLEEILKLKYGDRVLFRTLGASVLGATGYQVLEVTITSVTAWKKRDQVVVKMKYGLRQHYEIDTVAQPDGLKRFVRETT